MGGLLNNLMYKEWLQVSYGSCIMIGRYLYNRPQWVLVQQLRLLHHVKPYINELRIKLSSHLTRVQVHHGILLCIIRYWLYKLQCTSI